MTQPEGDLVRPRQGQGYSARWSSHDESPTRQRIRREVYGDDYPVEADPRSFVTVTELRAIATVSIGIAFLSDTGGDADVAALLEAADRALYAAKHDGRNRVHRYAA